MPADVLRGPTAVVAAAKALPFGVAVTDPHGIVQWANAAYAQLTACFLDELPGQCAEEFVRDALPRAAASSQPWSDEVVCRRNNGEAYTARHTVTALRDPAGEVTGFWITKEDIAGLKRPNHAEASLSACIESTDDIVWSVDLRYRLVSFNRALYKAFERSFGVRPAGGMGPEDLLPPARAALWPPLYERLLSEGPFRSEYTLRDGRILEMAFHPIVYDGRTTGISVFGKDITERKTAENKLLEAERKYRNIFDGAPAGMYRTTLRGRCLAANPAIARMLGYDSVEEGISAITDTAHQGWMDPDDRSRCLRLLEAQDAVRDYECQFKRKDGTPIWVSVNIRKTGGPDEEACYEGFVEDITKRKRAEEAIRKANEATAQAERYYRLMFNSVSDAVFVSSLRGDGSPGRFLDVNDQACRFLGYSREELLQVGPLDITAPEALCNIDAIRTRLLAEGHSLFETVSIAKDGRRIFAEVNAHAFDINGTPMLLSSVRDISERHDAEKQYRDIFDGALEGIYRTSLEGKNLAANPALARMLGYDSPEEVVSTIVDSANQVWANPNDRAGFLHRLEQYGSVRGYECQYKRKDGTVIWVSLSGRIVYGADGRALYTDGFVQDITERRRMEQALRRSEEKFAKVFLCSPAVSILFTPEAKGNRIADVNEAFEQNTGFRREEVIGRTTQELDLWADPNDFGDFMNRFRAAGRLRNFEHRVRKKNGEIGVGLTSAELVELDDLPYAISATIDITEQKKAELAMTTLVTAIEQTSETVVITDLEGAIQYCNPAFEKVTGYSKEEVVGQNPRLLKSGKHSAGFYQEMWATITQGKVWSGHLTNKKKDGSLYEEDATISPIRDASGKLSGFVAVKRDVTDRLQLEEQLRQAQKMESVGRLAGGVAHDFNNLLTVINGYSGFLLKKLKAGDPLREYADEIKAAGERAASLTKQLLAFSRKQLIEPKVLDLNTTIRQSAPMLQRLIGEDITLQTHLDDSLGKVLADPDQMHQVIMNLALNARDAMPDGGKVDIETRNVELSVESSSAIRPDTLPGRYVRVTMTDNGQGMDETTRQQIFEPFFTTKELGRGTGLGLATVYGIIRQGGGWVDVASEVGVGTSFQVYLPQVDVSGTTELAGAGGPTEAAVETLLVVEDQESVRSFAVAALKGEGYRVIEASDGNEAIAVAGRHPEGLHLLLTDVVMPGMNGKELSERLRALHPNMKVLFISGYTADVIAHRGVLDPGVAFLHKPFNPEELAAKVREVLSDPLQPPAGR